MEALLKRGRELHLKLDPAGALECLAGAAVVDVRMSQGEFVADIRGTALLADLAREWLGAWADARQPKPAERRGSGPMRLVYVVPNVSACHSPSMNLVKLIEWHTRDAAATRRIEVHVIVCEEFTARNPPLARLQFLPQPSEHHGAEHLSRLRSRCPVRILSTSGTHLDAASEGVAIARALEPDVALFMGSAACPVQTAMAAARIAPVQACISIGAPMLSPGIDVAIFNNPVRQEEDAPFVEARGIEALGVPTSGGDARAGADIAPFPRTELGIPDGVPVAASLSNSLVTRMLAGTFARDLAGFLRRNPDVWWLGIGHCDPAPFRRLLDSTPAGADVKRRCVFAGGWSVPWGMVKSCDVLLNEYPQGGGNSVIEAMGCGVPVVAMRAGFRHADLIGAILVGDDAIPTNDVGAYWSLASRWLRDPIEAKAAGARQRARALAELDYGVICDRYERIALDLCHRRVRPLALPVEGAN